MIKLPNSHKHKHGKGAGEGMLDLDSGGFRFNEVGFGLIANCYVHVRMKLEIE